MSNFKVRERSVIGKVSDDLCEDIIVVSDGYAAVIDGATDLSADLLDGMKPGRFAAQSVARTITELPADASAADAFAQMTEGLARDVRRAGGSGHPFCVGVVFSAARREIWRIGDPLLLIDGTPFDTEIPFMPVVVDGRRTMIEGALAEGATVESLLTADPGEDLIRLLTKPTRALINHPTSPLAFAAVNGTAIPDRLIEIIPVPHDARHLVLASDGYPVLQDTLDASEVALAEILASDPLLIGAHAQARNPKPGWKSFDDRSYLSIDIAS